MPSSPRRRSPGSRAVTPSGPDGLDRSLWLLPGVAALIAFAWMLALSESDAAGRTYAACGGIYICASLAWLWLAEGVRPGRWDLAGAAICLVGTGVILFGFRVGAA